MSGPAPLSSSLDALLAAYDRAFARAMAGSPPLDLRDADAEFDALRQAVARCWPAARAAVDALGAAANDLIDAVTARRDGTALHTAHARALFDLRVALCGARREDQQGR